MSKKQQHVHKYERTKFGSKGFEIYKCALANCPHYVPAELAAGRLSLCWGGGCHRAVMMTREMVQHDKTWRPLCSSCKQARKEDRKMMKLARESGEVA
jgi:hypothetical protein